MLFEPGSTNPEGLWMGHPFPYDIWTILPAR